MRRQLRDAIFLVTASALSMSAAAQTVYKCGQTYSQTPCPGAVPLSVDDGRSAAQKAQSQAVIKQDAKNAEAMQKDRLAQEKRDLAANQPQAKALAGPASASKAASSKPNPKKRADEFTADVPQDKADKSATRKKRKVVPFKKKSPSADQPLKK